jgi:hypothetical protein
MVASPATPTSVFEQFCMGIKFAVHHRLAINIHGRSDVGVTHHFLLNPYRRSDSVRPTAKGVAESMPPESWDAYFGG